MFIDALNKFAEATSVAAVAGTALIGDVIDLQEARDLGNSKPMYLVILCHTSIITAGNAGTIKFQLVSDAQAAIAADGTATVHFDTGTFVTDDAALNDLDAGDYIAKVILPLEANKPYERYLGILCTIATTEVTAGKITAFLTTDVPAWKAQPDAVN